MRAVKHCAAIIAALALPVLPASAALGSPTPEPAPPHDIPLKEKKWDELADKNVSSNGEKALAINPQKWKHAETDNFIIHFRRVTEAQKVTREVEYDLWFVAKSLGATKDRYKRKSHVFVFADEKE